MFDKRERPVPPDTILPRLREVTSSLTRDPDTKVFKTEGGKDCVVRKLMARDKVGVVDAGIPEGESFPFHAHENGIVECLMIYEGVAAVEYSDGSAVRLEEKDVVVFRPGQLHRVTALKGFGNVRLVGITIPKDKGYPGDDE